MLVSDADVDERPRAWVNSQGAGEVSVGGAFTEVPSGMRRGHTHRWLAMTAEFVSVSSYFTVLSSSKRKLTEKVVGEREVGSQPLGLLPGSGSQQEHQCREVSARCAWPPPCVWQRAEGRLGPHGSSHLLSFSGAAWVSAGLCFPPSSVVWCSSIVLLCVVPVPVSLAA